MQTALGSAEQWRVNMRQSSWPVIISIFRVQRRASRQFAKSLRSKIFHPASAAEPMNRKPQRNSNSPRLEGWPLRPGCATLKAGWYPATKNNLKSLAITIAELWHGVERATG